MEIETWQLFLLLFAAISLVLAIAIRVWNSLHWSDQNKIKEKAMIYGVFIVLTSAAAYIIASIIKWNMTH
ncbi:hypothetical protein AH04_220 [Erwinia phage AH04]|uniref:Uncharacterized protein n=1 Tax=Erwinia phage AH04 TaxID=2869569 RepID=A0AAE8BR07_9CAUD|nr:hypothetical protein PQC02_gp094 [Erwinia phage AH04]QZA70695.1 hypothetical protein AH04_220 [Erwinia phage AH04]